MRKNISVEFTNERIIPSGGLAVVGAILGKSDFVKRCNRMKVDCNHPQRQIKNGDSLTLAMTLLKTVKRCRHRTVSYNLVNMACHITEHA